MKKAIRTVLIVLAIFLFITIPYVGYQYIHLKLYVKSENIIVPELTSKHKEEDFRFLTQYVRDCYPYGDAVEKQKGLDNILDFEDEYIKRAGETKDNLEFLNLFIEYSQRLGQAGHWGVQWSDTKDYSWPYSYIFDIPKDAYNKTDYWLKLATNLPLYVHSDMNIVYSDGKYMLSEDYTLDDVIIPHGTVIEKVNGMDVDSYVKTLQDKQGLRYDDIKNKVYLDNLFMNNPGRDVDGWYVEFILPDSSRYSGNVKKIDGYKAPYILKLSTGRNVICRELGDKIGYIKIFSFFGDKIASDNETIQEFMNESGGKYKKLIIDVRGNIGGEPESWMNNIIRPLLKEPMEYDRITAVKKAFSPE